MHAAEWSGGRVSVEGLNDVSTAHGKRRVLARRGRGVRRATFSASCLGMVEFPSPLQHNDADLPPTPT